jgi:hypothetical protein
VKEIELLIATIMAAIRKVLIIRMRHVRAIDSTAMPPLRGTAVFFSDVHVQPLVARSRSELLLEIGEENLFGNVDEALTAAQAHLSQHSRQQRGYSEEAEKTRNIGNGGEND